MKQFCCFSVDTAKWKIARDYFDLHTLVATICPTRIQIPINMRLRTVWKKGMEVMLNPADVPSMARR
jgi:hypothetical protein